MSGYQIYVLSRGKGRKKEDGTISFHGYKWAIVEEKSTQLKKPPIELKTIELLADPEHFNLIIGRNHSYIYLFIWNLNTDRTDHTETRPIQNSIAIFAEPTPQNDSMLRGLITKSLRNPEKFATLVDEKIRTDSTIDLGFKVDPALIQELTKLKAKDSKSSIDEAKVEFNEDYHSIWNDLADEIDRHVLPQKNGILIVASVWADAGKLWKEGVWRAYTAFSTIKRHVITEEQKKNILLLILILLSGGLLAWLMRK